MSTIDSRLEKEMRGEMALCLRELLGVGFVFDYYHQLAGEFVEIAISYGACQVEDNALTPEEQSVFGELSLNEPTFDADPALLRKLAKNIVARIARDKADSA